jgi:hypothetical protein
MTICIAAICENDTKNPKIIMASDRMVTYGSSVQFEHKSPKLTDLSPNCVITTSGYATIHTDIIKNAGLVKSDNLLSVRETADKIKDSYDDVREQIIENTILKKIGIKNFKEFYKLEPTISENFSEEIRDNLDDFEFDLTFLISGIDDDGAHIYKIDDTVGILPLHSMGYASIGIGAQHANSIFFSTEYYDKCPLNKALYVVYKAKRIAEKAPGVGSKYIDLWIISKTQTTKISDGIIGELESMYNAEQKAIKESVKFDNLNKFIKSLNL